MTSAPIVVGLGEVLWDLLPSGPQLGGAPANFAYCSRLLGNSAAVASRIGDDRLGNEIRERLGLVGVGSEHLQTDTQYPTGTVKVTLDSSGVPNYEIVQGVAWDFLEWSPQWRSLAKSADAVCFGSLAQRCEKSRRTIYEFLETARSDKLRIFDVNLRQHFYSREIIEESLQRANVVKLNRDELLALRRIIALSNHRSDDESASRALMEKFELRIVCVTYGGEGSLVCDEFHAHRHPGFKVPIKDTVGSGDAFTAGLVHGILRGQSLSEMNELANRMGAWVTSSSGGMPGEPEAGLMHTLMSLGGT